MKCEPGHRLCSRYGDDEIIRNYCAAKGRGGLVCTREEGHKGNHVACSLDAHNLAQWGNETLLVRENKHYRRIQLNAEER